MKKLNKPATNQNDLKMKTPKNFTPIDSMRHYERSFENSINYYNCIKKCNKGTANEALGVYKMEVESKPYWWDEDIEKDVRERRYLNQRFLVSKKQEDKMLFKESQARVRRKITQN